MNEDFGVGRRSNNGSNNLSNPSRPAVINPNNYQPSANILPRPMQSVDGVGGKDSTSGRRGLKGVVVSEFDEKLDTTTRTTTGTESGATDKNKSGSSSANSISSTGALDDLNRILSDTSSGKQPWYKRLKHFFTKLTRKQWIIIGSVVLLITAGSAAAVATILKDAPPPPKAATITSKPKPAPPAPPPKPTSPLTGVEVGEEDTKRPVIGVMIENSTFARPQSGLRDAGVVYEAIAEYGITRFLALYQEAAPGNIGPVRSARPYYVDWARSYDASYAHVGGSPDALAKIRAEGIRDIDQFANSGYYRRIREREAPHNVYTTMAQLRELTAKKGWTSSTFTGLARKKEAPVKPEQITAKAIDIAISGPTYSVHYDYDAASNSYQRTMAGAPHNDADSGARIAPKVVIGLATSYGLLPDGYHSSYSTTGSGAVKIFQDGTVTEGTWTREGTGQYQFKDATGKPIALNPGQTWITAVGNPAAVTFSAPPPPAPAATPAP